MVYLGREIWLFLTEEGRPGALYSVSGRSQSSRQREAVYYQKEGRVAIEPLDKSQEKDALRHYNAMRFHRDFLAVSNGLHTETIYESGIRGRLFLRNILNEWGPEPDSLKTPRIAGTINSLFQLSVITEDGNARSRMIHPPTGVAYGISTYSGKGSNPEPFEIELLLKNELPGTKVEGKSPEDISRFFTDKVIDREFFVCCSTAVRNEESGEWNVSVLNKSE